jgi:hypothetical protein
MTRITKNAHAAIWVAIGCWCVYPALVDGTDAFYVFLAAFGAASILNAVACVFRWHIWWISSRVLGLLLVFYALSVMLFGPDHVGGAMSWLLLVSVLAFGIWSIVIPARGEDEQLPAEPVAAGNRRPADRH